MISSYFPLIFPLFWWIPRAFCCGVPRCPRNLANALRNLGRRPEALQLVWRHIGEAAAVVDLAKAEATEEKLVIAPDSDSHGGPKKGGFFILILGA